MSVSPSDYIFEICSFEGFILDDESFEKDLKIFLVCLSVDNNLYGNQFY